MNKTTDEVLRLLKSMEQHHLYGNYMRAGVRDSRFDCVNTMGWPATLWVCQQLNKRYSIFDCSLTIQEFESRLQQAWEEAFGYIPNSRILERRTRVQQEETN